jgi:hypothetical protein
MVEQDCFVTSSDHLIMHPSAFQRLSDHLHVRQQPAQRRDITSSEEEYVFSLSNAERTFYRDLTSLWWARAHRDIDAEEFQDEMRNIEESATEIAMERQQLIKEAANWRIHDRIKQVNAAARLQFYVGISKIVREAKKHHESQLQSESRILTTAIQIKLYAQFYAARQETVTMKQARKTVVAVARKFHLHSAEQLWRSTKTDRSAQIWQQMQHNL